MSITNYATLVTALDGVDGWFHRSGLTARIGEFVQLCESDLQVRCKLMEFEAQGTVAVTAGVGALPADLQAVRSVYWSDGTNNELEYIPPDQYNALIVDGGTPRKFTVTGTSLKVTPFDTGSAILTYSARFTALSGGVNSLITNYPDVYLFGTLKQKCLYVGDDAEAQKWSAMLDQSVSRITINNEERKYAGPLSVRTM